MADDNARVAQLEAELRRLRDLHAAEIAMLGEHLARSQAERDEAREQQTATAEILRVIASTDDLSRVFETVADHAYRVCNASSARIWLVHGDQLRCVASRVGADAFSPAVAENLIGTTVPVSRQVMSGWTALEGKVLHVDDYDAPENREKFPTSPMPPPNHPRTRLHVPLLHDGVSIGVIAVGRQEVRRFSQTQVALLETFADQAVIAIENARLFEELERRNAELQESNRQVTEALEQQMATSDVLRVIATSPMDQHKVLTAIVSAAVRLTESDGAAMQQVFDGRFRPVALAGSAVDRVALAQANGVADVPVSPRAVSGRALLERRTLHLPDVAAAIDTDFPDSRAIHLAVGNRSMVTTPLLRGEQALGVLSVHRYEVRPYTDQQIALLETFADQAVIAIENARLFRELADLNRTLEARVDEQVAQLERVGRLRRYLSPQLADVIISSGDESILESHRRQITVVFCDLRGFTAFAETAEPEEVMGVLAEYYEALGALVRASDGTLDHFAGDGMMVFFNDPLPQPDHAERAVRLACAMRERAADLARGWRRAGHELGFGVGVAAGYATLGRIGFEGRYDYTAIGSVANLAARLCGEAQGGQVLIPARLLGMVEDVIDAEPVGTLALKGFHRTVEAFNVTGLRDEHTDEG
jgi:class 3 adenylate cyclase/putative methionine-R-sulfoxide reductase with GAF domain